MRILHTADIQLGARFTQFSHQAHLLREARFQTLETIIHRAESENVSVLTVAGDLFDDNQISREISQRAYDILTSNPRIHVLVCPGNHDPYLPAGSVWSQSHGAPQNPIFTYSLRPNPSLFMECTSLELHSLRKSLIATHPSFSIPSHISSRRILLKSVSPTDRQTFPH